MSLLKIKTVGNSILKLKAQPVEDITEDVKGLISDMIETMNVAKGLGLAAPQVGVSKRIIILDIGYLEYDELASKGEELPENPSFKPKVFINPEIISSEGAYEIDEGCLSVPGYRSIVERKQKLIFRYIDIDGNLVEEDAQDLKAVAVQHEIDHLDGILFIDRISRIKKRSAIKKVQKYLEKIKVIGVNNGF